MLFPRQTPILVLSNLIIFGVIFAILNPVYIKRSAIPQWRYRTSIILAFLFCLFSFWGTDWFHYQDIFTFLKIYPDTYSHMEEVYLFLIKISPNYFVFRSIIFGSALVLFLLSIQRIKFNNALVFFFFATLYLPLFAYGRFSLAISMVFYGSSLIICPYKKISFVSRMMGIAILLAAFFFHKSAIIAIIIAILSLNIKKITKNSWFYIIIGFVLSVMLIEFIIPQFLSSNLSPDNAFAQTSQEYIAREEHKSTFGIGQIIYIILERTPYYLIALISYKIKTEFEVSKSINFLLNFMIFLVLFASLFLFDFGANTSIFYRRLLRFSFIPASIIMGYAYHYKLYPKLTRFSFIISFISSGYFLSYALYLSIVK